MNVYVIFNACPKEFSYPRIVQIYSTKKRAVEKMNKLISEEPYENQYYEIYSVRVRK